ncbi:MAG: fumarylacetoacetate hydrolase family protein [Proteobacteria bacterium]|nr:fumarylacetoacetate hydrolase family protein [Pseudomonadota bacterium]
MTAVDTDKLADEILAALAAQSTIEPISTRFPDATVDDAYAISTRILERRLANGETLVGRKIGLTSEAVQRQLGVGEPDFGNLTDAMMYPNGATLPISERLIQPRAEGEVAFVLGRDLAGPGVTEAGAIRATEYVTPCFEIVDSRVRDWDIRLVDTVSDNASCGLVLLGDDRADPRELDLPACRMTVYRNGEVAAEGTGAAALGSPACCVAWLANALSRYGVELRAGDVVLSGSLVPFLPIAPGDSMRVEISGIGSASVGFC